MNSELAAIEQRKTRASGVIYASAAFLLWGLLPLYWKLLEPVPAVEILMHRIIWSFVFTALLVWRKRQWGELKGVFFQRRKLILILISAVLVSTNWGIYIWAVNAGHVVDTSLGYYINPLLSVCLGMLILRERLNFWQLVSLAAAFIGVAIIAFEFGKIPWTALSLAFTFGLYGLIKKVAALDSIVGLALETMFLSPLALVYLGYLQFHGQGSFGHASPLTTLLLAGAGVSTALPLIWFARAAQQMPLSTVGFIQYLTPTMMLILGVFLYREPFTAIHLMGFALIWAALALFSLSQLKWFKKFSASAKS